MMQSRLRARQREALAALLFLLPNILGFLVFMLGPLIASFLLSFTEWDLLSPMRLTWFGNYRNLLVKDPLFWKSIYNTFYYTLGSVPLGMTISLFIAVVLNRKIRGTIFFRTVYFLPVISSTVAIALLWRWLFYPDLGLINYLLGKINIHGPNWLQSTIWAMPAVIIMSTWKGLGYNMVLYLAGLQGIPSHLYEAAIIDGASEWQQFWRITFPLLSPTSFFVLIMSLIGSFQVFDQTYIMTRGGPAYATTTIVYYIYQNGFQWFKMGYASALAWILFAIILIVTIIQWIFQKRWVFYYD